MEERLKAYRRTKSRMETIDRLKKNIGNFFGGTTLPMNERRESKTSQSSCSEHGETEEQELLITNDEPDCDLDSVISENETFSYSRKKLISYILKIVVWCLFYSLAIKIEFGAVFFALSLLCFIFYNTRTRPKRSNEVSAYSVFNEDCKSIDGTLTAEKLQREMFLGGVYMCKEIYNIQKLFVFNKMAVFSLSKLRIVF